MAQGTGALFIAECSHQFHYACISSPNILECPLCRCRWQQKPGQHPQTPSFFTTPNVPLWHLPRLDQWRSVYPEDDIEVIPEQPSSSTGTRSLEISIVPEQESVPPHEQRDNFTFLVTLRAPRVALEEIRSPVDLVTILDVSGSMEGQKLELVKRAMKFVIQNLRPQDRLSIVSFSDSSHVNLPLKRMLDGGKTAAVSAVQNLRSMSTTNITSALRKGFSILGSRRQKNPVASIMLLTDGQHNTGGPLTVQNYLPANRNDVYPVYTFGFGMDHDSATMHGIAEATRGSFCYVETESNIQHAFAQCIGGLLSVVAQDVKVDVSAGPGVRIRGLEATVGNSTSSEAQASVDVGTVYSEEHKDFLVTVALPVGVTEILVSRGSYKDPNTNQVVTIPSRGHLMTRGEEASEMNIQVDREKNRIMCAKAMAQGRSLAYEGRLELARAALSEAKRKIESSRAFLAGDENSKTLASDLEKQMQIMGNSDRYTAERGVCFAASMAHASQRQVYSGGPTSAFDSGTVLYSASASPSPRGLYGTHAMGAMLKRSFQTKD